MSVGRYREMEAERDVAVRDPWLSGDGDGNEGSEGVRLVRIVRVDKVRKKVKVIIRVGGRSEPG